MFTIKLSFYYKTTIYLLGAVATHIRLNLIYRLTIDLTV